MAKLHYTLWTLLLISIVGSGFAKTVEDDQVAISEFLVECANNTRYLVAGEYDVSCSTMYQHYNSDSIKQYSASLIASSSKVRISGFNLWHPGNQNSGFKDYTLIAKIINKSDITAALELLPIVSLDAKNNRAVLEVLTQGPVELRDLKAQLKIAKQSGSLDKVQELTAKIAVLTNTLKNAPSLYRAPGYLKILTELRKLDKSWSLLLSPRGDAAKPNHVKELTGFYYRGRTVKPVANEHCQETYSKVLGKKYACFPNLSRTFMGRDTGHVFSRRPLLASFKSGEFDFSLLTSHVVFGSPHPVEYREDMERILEASFGVGDYKEIGTGVDSRNYARFAETKIILELMNLLKLRYREKDIMYVGDMNLTFDNSFWSELLAMDETGEHKLLVEEKTSLSIARTNRQGVPTEASSSNYDHFIIPKDRFQNCMKRNGEYDTFKLPYLEGDVYTYVRNNYIVRSKRIKDENKYQEDIYPEDVEVEESYVPSLDYQLTRVGEKKMIKMISNLEKKLNKVYTIKRNEIVKDSSRIEQKLSYFKDRVFLSQLNNSTFYRVYKEVISDHYPIFIHCSTK